MTSICLAVLPLTACVPVRDVAEAADAVWDVVDNGTVPDDGCRHPDHPCDCFYSSVEVVDPVLPDPFGLRLCSAVGESLTVPLRLRVRTCPMCGCPTCRLESAALYDVSGGFKPWVDGEIEVALPPRDDGASAVGADYEDGAEFFLDVIYTPTKEFAEWQEASLRIDLRCGSPNTASPIGVDFRTLEGPECGVF